MKEILEAERTTAASEKFGRRLVQLQTKKMSLPDAPFKVKNALPGHPLFENERIKRLLRTVPREWIEIRAVQSTETNDGSYRQGPLLTDADPIDTFERLEERPRWMLIHKSWVADKDYEQLIREYLRDLTDGFDELKPGVSDIGCWMFLSSGKSVVHFHCDPDQSFLNQVRGSKTVVVYPTSLLPEEEIEKLVYTQEHGQPYKQEYEKKAHPPVHLGPGESVFLPLYAPHRVVNDESVSVSWNVGFHTEHSRQRRTVHLVNRELRALGIHPSEYSRSPLRDAIKARMSLALRVKNKLVHTIERKAK